MAREKGLFLPSPCHDWQESPFQKPKVFRGGPAALHGGTLHHSGTSRRRWSMASADLESLAQALKQGRVAVLTGAGCSTESGIPDYRGSDRKSTRLNSSHVKISYAVFCLKKKKEYKS